MSFRLSISVGLFIFFSILAYWAWMDQHKVKMGSTPKYPIERNIRYSYQVKNISGAFIKETHFWSYAPVKLTATQKTIGIQSSSDYVLTTDKRGNQTLLFTIRNIPPYGTRIVTIDVKLGMSKAPNILPQSEDAQFLKAEPYIEIDSPEIKQLSSQLHSVSSYETAASIFNWVTQNIKDEGYVKNDRGAVYAINSKSGDCTEYMYLLTALNRRNGIPTQGVSGFVVREDAVLHSREYHNWTMALIDGAWQVIDPYKKVFMDNSADYIAMRLLGGDESGQSQTLFGMDAGIDVVMH
ncbi:transglutaminase-like domain-containing protein [Sedimenticola sp.]|uniref:transglutaminase-like domain-containing protein n=1 Tax=Sedimenticola sp. TaxID=1940285 RepID=UPI003D0F789A